MENKYYQKIDYELLDKKVAYKGKRIVVEELHYKNPRNIVKHCINYSTNISLFFLLFIFHTSFAFGHYVQKLCLALSIHIFLHFLLIVIMHGTWCIIKCIQQIGSDVADRE